jgi:hypothetical protein
MTTQGVFKSAKWNMPHAYNPANGTDTRTMFFLIHLNKKPKIFNELSSGFLTHHWTPHLSSHITGYLTCPHTSLDISPVLTHHWTFHLSSHITGHLTWPHTSVHTSPVLTSTDCPFSFDRQMINAASVCSKCKFCRSRIDVNQSHVTVIACR